MMGLLTETTLKATTSTTTTSPSDENSRIRSSSSRSSNSPPTATTVSRAEIVGGTGRIGSLLAQAGNCRMIGRGEFISSNIEEEGTPILIATRNDALKDVVDACPLNRRSDLVFLQNGYLDAFLHNQGFYLGNRMPSSSMTESDAFTSTTITRSLLYLSVPKRGDPPVDGVTTMNPKGLTCVTGKHAAALAERLEALNLKCRVVTNVDDYQVAMFEKLIWICTYMLVGTAKGCTSVGQAQADYPDLVQQVIAELVMAAKAAVTTSATAATTLSFDPLETIFQRLASYTDVVADFPCAVKEFAWRNQYFYQLVNVNSNSEACPIHNALLRECASLGRLHFALP